MNYRKLAHESPEVIALKEVADKLYNPYLEVSGQSDQYNSAVEAYIAAAREGFIKAQADYLDNIVNPVTL